ncbi:hypothetical protein D3C85_1818310 [compost metagenome]
MGLIFIFLVENFFEQADMPKLMSEHLVVNLSRKQKGSRWLCSIGRQSKKQIVVIRAAVFVDTNR